MDIRCSAAEGGGNSASRTTLRRVSILVEIVVTLKLALRLPGTYYRQFLRASGRPNAQAAALLSVLDDEEGCADDQWRACCLACKMAA